MPEFTNILGLEKPFQEEDYNVDVFNDNAQKLDDYMIPDRVPAEITVKGRTLVNLLGRAGNAIYQQDWTIGAQLSFSYDLDAFKLNSTDGTSYAKRTVTVESNRCYVLLSEIYNDDGLGYSTLSEISPNGGTLTTTLNKKSDHISVRGFKTLADTTGVGIALVPRKINADVLFKNIRLYKISESEYNSLDSMTADEIAIKYPYVDDVKPVVNPYIESKENLLEGLIYSQLSRSALGGIEGSFDESPILSSILRGVESGIYTLALEGINTDIYSVAINNHDIVSGHYNGVVLDTNTPTSITLTDVFNVYISVSKKNATMTKGIAKEILEQLQTRKWKITMVKGSVSKSYNECHNSRIMFETRLYDGETISRRNDGQYVKNSECCELILADLTYVYDSTYSKVGYKCIRIINDIFKTVRIGSWDYYKFVDYFGGTIKFVSNGTEYSYWIDMNNGIFYLMIPNTLSGWSDAYIPTTGEIKAFFLGWKMYNSAGNGGAYTSAYNGTGYKWFAKLWCSIISTRSPQDGVYVVAGSHTSTCPTTLNDQGYTPYRLIYKKATPTLEEIKVHGSLDISKDSIVTVGSGLVLGDVINTMKNDYQTITRNIINNPSYLENRLKYRVDDFIKIYNMYGKIYSVTKWIFTSYTGYTQYIPGWIILRGVVEASIDEDTRCLVDYLVYKPDTVTAFDYTITTPEHLKETLNKAIEELSNTNKKLSKSERELARATYELSQRSNPNLLINGDFQVAQRGSSFSSSTHRLGYTFDRWYLYTLNAGANFQLTQNIDNSMRFSKILDGNTAFICQSVENLQYFSGKKVTLSIKYRTNRAGLFSFGLREGPSPGSNTSFAYAITDELSGTQSLTINLPTYKSGANVFVYIQCPTVSVVGDYIDIEWIKLELGEFATPFVPRTYAEELAMCQRYYERFYNPTQSYCRLKNFDTANQSPYDLGMNVTFKVAKRVIPTVVFDYDINDGTLLSATPSNIGIDGFKSTTPIVPPNQFIDVNSWTADAEIY
jgi:hypothetical protein